MPLLVNEIAKQIAIDADVALRLSVWTRILGHQKKTSLWEGPPV
jgi:hypothetical protein